jgi:hypothetical protein
VSGSLPNVTAPDAYGTTGTLSCPATARVRLLVNNNGIWWRRGVRPPGGGGVFYEAEEFLIPGLYSLDELCDLIQVRAAIPLAKIAEGESQAQVTVTTRTATEIGE